MVLLSPSVGALRRLLKICEQYAVAHGLRYNAKISELLVFKAGTKTYNTVPPITLDGASLKQVKQFKYLGHWVTDALTDNLELDRERRALTVRCNMLARRFARYTNDVKLTLFKAYCQTLYTCGLWVNYMQKSFNALKVQYNSTFRMLLRLPPFCSASGMFAEARTDGFDAVVRKRVSSTMSRMRGSDNSLLNTISEDVACPILCHWTRTHVTKKGW
ncbi:uncharacterized protein LOC113226724 [Hyposmocoma kahamanoa]|uniref:uncharacterized protein LOC113226724 n=1 Tax=Hyposmocoma kahamanoa TaxID=1477025 RepID=UPI000E6D7DE3|nr:uncharacterized protein LOC113226724 [Hyposmocoma kahamanoa]